MWDDAERSYVDIVICSDLPDPGLTSCSTLSLHETTNLLDGRDVRVELAGTCLSDQPIVNMLATAALNVINDAWLAAPDVVMRDAVSRYDAQAQMKHLLLSDPFPVPALGALQLDDGMSVHWLFAVPISDTELDLALEAGVPELSRRLETADAAYYDLHRPSVV